VCVDGDWRGRGLAARLLDVLCRGLEARGDTPFLHVFSDNKPAIGLYEGLGFALRRTFFLTRIGLEDRK
jgi:predicted GNAT family acetyltransferase